jgi:hypothetical protein
MIIWGTKYLDKIEREGEFYCPSCQTRRPFRLWKKRRWGHLYWIPLFPGKFVGSWVKCGACSKEFDQKILSYDPDKQRADFEVAYRNALGTIAGAFLGLDGHPGAARLAAYEGLIRDWGLEKALAMNPNPRAAIEETLAPIRDQLSDVGKERLITAAALIAYSDGKISEASWAALNELRHGIGMSEAHLRGTLQGLWSNAASANNR